jgi:hypothetical protein
MEMKTYLIQLESNVGPPKLEQRNWFHFGRSTLHCVVAFH